MIRGKEISYIVVLSTLNVVLTFIVGQTATMISGLPGANYVFTILYAILTSFSLLVYEGKRWMFFVQTTLFALLIIPTFFGGVAFDVVSKAHFIANAFFIDLLFNSFYSDFKKNNSLKLWAVLGTTTYWAMSPLWGTAIKSFFYSPEYINLLVSVVSMLFPLILIEAIIGGWIGYKTFMRIHKIKT